MDSDLSPYRECSLNTHCLRKELASLTSAWAGLDSVALVRLKLPTDLLVWQNPKPLKQEVSCTMILLFRFSVSGE